MPVCVTGEICAGYLLPIYLVLFCHSRIPDVDRISVGSLRPEHLKYGFVVHFVYTLMLNVRNVQC